MAQFDYPVVDLPPSYYPAIGEFLFRFAQLEYQMHEIVWLSLKLGYEQGRILTIGTDFKVLCGMIGTITHPTADVWVKEKSLVQEMNYIAGHGRKHISLRNRIAHGSWQSADGNPKNVHLHFMKEKEERLLPRVDRTLDEARIHRHAGELRNLNHRARKLLVRLLAASPAPPPQHA